MVVLRLFIIFQIYSFSECGSNGQCAGYFARNPSFSSNYIVSNTTAIALTAGYNRFLYNVALDVKIGSVIVLKQITGRIALDPTLILDYSDYIITIGATTNTLKSVRTTGNGRLLLTSLIDTSYYQDSIPVIRSYPVYLVYNFTAKISNSDVFYKARLDLLFCNTSLSLFYFYPIIIND